MTKSEHLAHLVALHEDFFGALGQQHATSDQIRQFITGVWDPFYTRWSMITADGSPLGDALVRDVAKALSDVRAQAIAQNLPVPDLGSIPAPAQHTQASRVSIEAAIDRETDERFWREMGYKPGQRLDPHDPIDAQLIPTWINLRYQIALERGRVADPHQPMFASQPTEVHMSYPRHVSGKFSGHVSGNVSVAGGACGARTFSGVTPAAIDRIFARLRDKGADVLGSNPWHVITHDHGVELDGAWNAQTGVLKLEVTDSDFIAPCGAVWSALEDMLSEVGAQPASATIVGRGGFHHGGGGRGRSGRGRFDQLGGGFGVGWGGGYYDGAYEWDGWQPGVLIEVPFDPGRDETLTDIAPVVSAGSTPEMCAGWWDDITGAVKKAVNTVGHAAKQAVGSVGHTLMQLKGPIAAAASAAAGAAALGIPGVGPLVAPMAGKLAGDLVNAAAGQGSVAQAAQAAVAQAKQAAMSNPQVAKALDLAHQAVAKSTIAHHLAQTTANAASGDPVAQAQIQQLAQSAAQGDPSAQELTDLASDVTDAVTDNAAVSGAVDDLRSQGSQRVSYAKGHGDPHPAFGVRIDAIGEDLLHFTSLDQASDWLATQSHSPHLYLAIYDAHDPTWPAPIEESSSDTKVSGVLLPFLLGAGAGAAAGYYGPKLYQQWHGSASTTSAGDVVGAAAQTLSEIAARTAAAAHLKGAQIVGVAVGTPTDPLAHTVAVFSSTDDADDWFARIASVPSAYGYVAYYDAGDPLWPKPMNAAHGQATAHADAHVSGFLPYLLAGGAGAIGGAYFWPAIKTKIDSMFAKKAA